MAGQRTMSIKQLHANTGQAVRDAGRSRQIVTITDRGRPVAVLVAPQLVPSKKRKRVILPQYAAWLNKRSLTNVLADLNKVREEG
jgi:antitoxin (DNA-binding transcriptional repressor) of toxin-antitoxin stability system